MITDKFGQPIFSEKDICDLYMSDPSRQLKFLFVKEKISFDLELNLQNLPELINYEVSDQTI